MHLELSRSGRGAVFVKNQSQEFLRALLPEELLIKVSWAPINPSDIGYVHGTYPLPSKPRPCVLGFEGSGIVEEVGDCLDRTLIGKRVSFLTNPKEYYGSFSTKTITDFRLVHPLKNQGLDMAQAACLMLNPLSVILMVNEALEFDTNRKEKRVLVNLFGSSQLGMMLSKYCELPGIECPLWSVYRSPEALERTLKTLGEGKERSKIKEGLVFHMGIEELKEKIRETKEPVSILSSAGDDLPVSLLQESPKDSSLIYYGWMGGKTLNNLDLPTMLSKNLSVKSFWLHSHLGKENTDEIRKNCLFIEENSKNVFESKIGSHYSLENYKEALREALIFKGGLKAMFKMDL